MSVYSARVSLGGQNTSLEIIHRPTEKVIETLPVLNAGPAHRSYILSTWVRSYTPTIRKLRIGQPGMPLLDCIDQSVYLKEEPRVAESLWQKTHIVSSDDGFTIFAWVCGVPGLLWHCYVTPELRTKGVARALIEHVCGPETEYARPWPLERKPKCLKKYNPYLLVVK